MKQIPASSVINVGGTNDRRLRHNQEEQMMGLLLPAMLYFAIVAVCIKVVS